MNARPIAILSVFCLLHASTNAFAQGAGWYPGPFDNGAAPNGVAGTILASTLWDPDGAGPLAPTLVVAGYFTSIGGVAANNIAMIDPATGQWVPLGSGSDEQIRSLTVYNGALIAGGLFTHAGGQTANYIASWNGSAWSPVGTEMGSYVYAVTVYNGYLIAGGFFTSADGYVANHIAQWDGTRWYPLGAGIDDWVVSLAQYDGSLFASGYFAHAGGAPANRIAAWNGSSWSSLGSGMDREVLCLGVFNGLLTAGGRFTVAGGVAASRVAGWNGSSWQAFGAGTNNEVAFLGNYTGLMIAGGSFTATAGEPAGYIAAWNGGSWQTLGSGTDGPAFSTIFYNGELAVGGSFTHAGYYPANNLARWDGFNWAPFGGGNVTDVQTLTRFGNRLVIGGIFNQSEDPYSPAHSVVGWDGASLTPFGIGMDGFVHSLQAYSFGNGVNQTSELVAGGSFTHAGGVAASYIARWDQRLNAFPPPAWQPMGSGFDWFVVSIERATVNSATNTYAAGEFQYSGGTYLGYIGRWNSTTQAWESMGGGMNTWVSALKSYGGYLYAGGSFTTAGGVSTGGLARWDGVSWSQVGGYFNGSVYALEVHNGALVIAGSFPGFGGSPNISTYDGVNYHNLGSGGTSGPVFALHSTGPRLYIGGRFSTAGGTAANNVAYWDGAWHPLTSGTDNTVSALSDYGGEIQVGGEFMYAGPIVSHGLARFSDTGVPWIAEHPSAQSVASGANVSFSATPASGYSGLSFQWSHNDLALSDGPTGTGPIISGSNTQALSIANVSTAYAGLYRMVLSNASGRDTSLSATLTVDGYVGVPSITSSGATVFEALGPNPSGGATRLAFSLARTAQVRVLVHDVAGRLVRVMQVGRLPAGQHQASWDARGDGGERVRAGIYFVGLEVNGHSVGIKRATILH